MQPFLFLPILTLLLIWMLALWAAYWEARKNQKRPRNSVLFLLFISWISLYASEKQTPGQPEPTPKNSGTQNSQPPNRKNLIPDSAKTSAASTKNTSSRNGGDSDSDTDFDGISDSWEIWTHGNKDTADSNLDRDGDGLTDLQEFSLSTDPRTKDTDADGFSDYFEYSAGMNPLQKENFYVSEPDENQNGLIDIWESTGYLYEFYDANEDGFDDSYKAQYLTEATEENFDIAVSVYTTRSALLKWTNSETSGGLILLSNENPQQIRLRFPFGVDTRLELLPEPDVPNATSASPSGLWKAEMKVDFLPRENQSSEKNRIRSFSGKVTIATPLQSGGAKVLSETSSRTGNATNSPDENAFIIDLSGGMMEISLNGNTGSGIYHTGDTSSTLFSITNALHVDTGNVVWQTSHGTMNPSRGATSTLMLPPNLPEGETILVEAFEGEELTGLAVMDTFRLFFCEERAFFANTPEISFSPHLYETATFHTSIGGCPHRAQGGFLEIEIGRIEGNNWVRIANVDMNPATEQIDRFLDLNEPYSNPDVSFSWDGISQVSRGAFPWSEKLIFPEGEIRGWHKSLTAGMPVPSPFCNYRIHVYDEQMNLVSQTSNMILIPQVYKFLLPKGISVFTDPICAEIEADSENLLLFSGMTATQVPSFLSKLVTAVSDFIPDGVNIRIVTPTQETHSIQTISLIERITIKGIEEAKGCSEDINPQNKLSNINIMIAIKSLPKHLKNEYQFGYLPAASCPLSEDAYLHYLANIIIHEIGHTVGMIDAVFNSDKIYGWHYASDDDAPTRLIMGEHGLVFYEDYANPGKKKFWTENDLRYLRYMLPKSFFPHPNQSE